MNFMIKYGFSASLLVIIVFLIKRYINEYKVFDAEKDKLFDFLSEKNEYVALKKLGAINPFGVREKWHVPSRKMREYLYTRDDLLKNIEVQQFLDKLVHFEKAYIQNFIVSLVLTFILLLLHSD